MIKQLSSIQGFPIARHIDRDDHLSRRAVPFAAMAGGGNDPIKITSKNEVKTISDAPLTDDMFAVPADYKKVDKPEAPASPFGGGGGGNL